ncbi:protein FAM50B isoform X2 [Suncus etruscus]|uniref:protein FAM50B isoform X2 n=1 Tax=Suncus etruscus TaxID=109475 RepID=UPI002110BB57|nr:protein FAM50B isoform X2 [Suncus etruscus]
MAQYKGTLREAGRAMHLRQKREQQKAQLAVLKERIAQETLLKSQVDKKFSAHYDAVEAELKSSTVGLVTLNDMKAKQEALVKEREMQLAQREWRQRQLEARQERAKRRERTSQACTLSFSLNDLDDEEDDPACRRNLGKNPDVDTSFLPDREREEAETQLREVLRREWEAHCEKVKLEEVEVTFSYWDGSGHRRTALVRKGSTVQQFLKSVLPGLRQDFGELRAAGVEQLLFVKEDLILPHHRTFYDFIVARARGKSGPLFSFDAHDDVRLRSDASREKDESHAGKVVLRSWYEKNKHIFPASRWEPYDPEKKWERYTVR